MTNKHLKLVVSNRENLLSMEKMQEAFGSFIMKEYDMFFTLTFDERLNAVVMARYLKEKGFTVSLVQREIGEKHFFYVFK